VHLFVLGLSISSVIVLATMWSNVFEAAVAFLLISAKVNSWTSPQSTCILTRLEGKWTGNPNIEPFIARVLRRVRQMIGV
jgi:hypothetical protein